MEAPSATRLRGRSVSKSSRSTQGKTFIKLSRSATASLRRSGAALNTDQFPQQQQQDASAAADPPAGHDPDGYADMEHDFFEQVPAAAVPDAQAPAASAASVRFRFSAAQRQQRTAASNRAASERNWAELQDPELWIASMQDRADVTASTCQMIEVIVRNRWVWPYCALQPTTPTSSTLLWSTTVPLYTKSSRPQTVNSTQQSSCVEALFD